MRDGHLGMPQPPIYSDLETTVPIAESELIKVPEGFFSADHPNTKMIVNLLNQGDLTRLRMLIDKGIASYAIFQIADRGNKGNNKSLFRRQAILFLTLIGLATYFNKGPIVSVIIKEGGRNLLGTQFATGVQSSDDILLFSTDYIAIVYESYDCVVPLLKHKFWHPYESTSLLYRRRYLQSRTPIIGYPDLLRVALLKSPNHNVPGFVSSAKRELVQFSLSRLIYLGSIMVQHFDVDLAAGKGTRRVFSAPDGPRFVLPNLCSLSRRLLVLVSYHDPNVRMLSQVLGALRECTLAGAFCTFIAEEDMRGSLLLWLQELMSVEHKTSALFRSLGPATQKLLMNEEDFALQDHYLRYDSLNCISLLLRLLRRFGPSMPDSLGFGRRIMDAACGIALQSGLAEPLLSFAWPDHLLALRSLAHPADMVTFEEFGRLLQHLPSYAQSLAATRPDMRGTDRYRVNVRRSVLRLDWNNADREMSSVMAGHTVPLVESPETAVKVLVSQEQAADEYQQYLVEGSKDAFDYAEFYRQFELRYRNWACQQPQKLPDRPQAMEFREDQPFREVYNTDGVKKR